MKRILAILLALLLTVAVFAGCASADRETTLPSTEVTTGETAATVETAAGEEPVPPDMEQLEKLHLVGTVFDGESSMRLTFSRERTQALTLFYIRIEDGAEIWECVSETDSEGGICAYQRTGGEGDFLPDTASTQAELEANLQEQYGMLAYFVDYRSTLEGVEYRLLGEQVASELGLLDCYEMTVEGVVDGRITVHHDTGIMVSMEDTEGTDYFAVETLTVEEAPVPAYKSEELLPRPEVTFRSDLHQMRLQCVVAGETMTMATGYAGEETAVYYVAIANDGLLTEMVYEIDPQGRICRYLRDETMEQFLADSITDQESLSAELETHLDLLRVFTGYEELLSGSGYRPAESDADTVTYEVVTEGRVTAVIKLDRATGILLGLYSEDRQPLMEITDLQTENVEFPVYK